MSYKVIKRIVSSFALALCLSAHAQTNSPSLSGALNQMWEAFVNSTNVTAVGGAGRSTSGNKDLAFGGVAYGFGNSPVGLYMGYEYLWAPHNSQPSSFNSVKGGVTLSTEIQPFKVFGGTNWFTKTVAKPYAGAFLSNPTGANQSIIGNITALGAEIKIIPFSKFELNAGGGVEKRQGQGYWNGTYPYFTVGLTKVLP